MSIFQKSSKWVSLVWKMFLHLWRVFLSYLSLPSAHILKNPKHTEINLINLFPLFSFLEPPPIKPPLMIRFLAETRLFGRVQDSL